MFARSRLRAEWHLRAIMLILMFGVLGCAVALEQRALIGTAVGAYWLMSQIVTLTLSYKGGGRERIVGRRVNARVAQGARPGARRGRVPLSAGRGRDVPPPRPTMPGNLYRSGYCGAPYAGTRSHGR